MKRVIRKTLILSIISIVLGISGCKKPEVIPPDFVKIPAGKFLMGSEAGIKQNRPVHEVTISNDFYMCDHEVTQAEYQSIMGRNPSNFKAEAAYGEEQSNRPVEKVCWYAAIVYCNRLSMKEKLQPCYKIFGSVNPDDWGDIPVIDDYDWNDVICDFNANGYRLPTEAEWEYAARAGDETIDDFTWSGINSDWYLDEYAWYASNSNEKTHEVKSFEEGMNAFGLYDMSGNVWEWCWDWWPSENDYSADSHDIGVTNPTGASYGTMRVYRGGSCFSEAALCAVSCRGGNNPFERQKYLGFRVCRSLSSDGKDRAKAGNSKGNKSNPKNDKNKEISAKKKTPRFKPLKIEDININDYAVDFLAYKNTMGGKYHIDTDVYGTSDSLYILGWSKEGYIAYIQLYEEHGFYEIAASVNFIVQDLHTDIVVYNDIKSSWDYSEHDNLVAKYIKDNKTKINKVLTDYKIVDAKTDFTPLPYITDDYKFDSYAKLTDRGYEDGAEAGYLHMWDYTIIGERVEERIDGSKKETKKLFSEEHVDFENLIVCGAMESPFKDRLIIIYCTIGDWTMANHPRIIGCSEYVGFE
ncbi:MAG: formylglycine-generating enzyme family protein [Treponema sp.]|nr:formylglycine-generating enzyme family protein [Treponema sp.]